MEELSKQDLLDLSYLIVQKIKDNFAIKNMSKNLINTIATEMDEDGIKIIIPAQTYNMLVFQKEGVVVHTSHGSYAEKLNESGSEFFIYPGETRKGSFKIKPLNHIRFADNAVDEAISEWTTKNNEKFEIESIQEQ